MTIKTAGAIIVGLIVVVAGVWYFENHKLSLLGSSQPEATTTANKTATTTSLGAQIYAKTNNPLNNVAATSTVVPNPVKNLYKNPFQ